MVGLHCIILYSTPIPKLADNVCIEKKQNFSLIRGHRDNSGETRAGQLQGLYENRSHLDQNILIEQSVSLLAIRE